LISKVGIVVPTLGQRGDYLTQCLNSIQKAGKGNSQAHIVMVAPKSFDASQLLNSGMIHQFVEDPGTGLSEAINAGFEAMPNEIQYINWLGDDDMLAPGSLEITSGFLDENPATVMVFGRCDYVDPSGEVIWTNQSGSWAVPLLRFGPDMIPQPGALFRKDSFFEAGGLDSRFDWAFDFDLFLKLSKLGKLSHVKKTLAGFRWHPESLSVGYRNKSVTEASAVRVSHLPSLLRPISWLWEYPVWQATLIAGNRVTKTANKKANKE
jgi:glycosyltransferase involved in cell wall biosynthesis